MTEGRQAHVGDSGAGGPRGTNVVPPGVWVDDSDEDDPVLRQADGSLVDTWREEYPYTERMTREEYDHLKRVLQVELLKLQYWIEDSGGRLVVIFRGP
jgi:polyphosphate kinase